MLCLKFLQIFFSTICFSLPFISHLIPPSHQNYFQPIIQLNPHSTVSLFNFLTGISPFPFFFSLKIFPNYIFSPPHAHSSPQPPRSPILPFLVFILRVLPAWFVEEVKRRFHALIFLITFPYLFLASQLSLSISILWALGLEHARFIIYYFCENPNILSTKYLKFFFFELHFSSRNFKWLVIGVGVLRMWTLF